MVTVGGLMFTLEGYDLELSPQPVVLTANPSDILSLQGRGGSQTQAPWWAEPDTSPFSQG